MMPVNTRACFHNSDGPAWGALERRKITGVREVIKWLGCTKSYRSEVKRLNVELPQNKTLGRQTG